MAASVSADAKGGGRRAADLLLSKGKPTGGDEKDSGLEEAADDGSDDGKDSHSEGMRAAMESFSGAWKDEDHAGMAKAMEDAYDMLSSKSHKDDTNSDERPSGSSFSPDEG